MQKIKISCFRIIMLLCILSCIHSIGFTQYTITGETCVLPGIYPGVYRINGNLGPTVGSGDRWCITNGTISGVSCYTNPGNPVVPGVVWNSGVTSGTLSYYRSPNFSTPVATITVNFLSWGTITPAEFGVPSGLPATVLFTAPDIVNSCGAGTITYQWERNTGSGYTIIAGATARDYTETAVFAQQIPYRRRVMINGLNFTYPTPNIVKPYTPHSTGTIGPATQTVFYYQSPAPLTQVTPPTSGAYGANFTFYWQSSDEYTPWHDIPGATNTGTAATSYQPGLLSVTTRFRIRVSYGPIATGVYTNEIVVNILSPLEGGTIIPENPLIPYDTYAGDINGNSAIRGNCSGTYSYQWQQSGNGAEWKNIPGATGISYSTSGNIKSTTYFRRRVELSCNSEIAYSNIAVIKVAPPVQNENYVRERVFKKPGITSYADGRYIYNLREAVQTTQYMDGLGRPIQKVIRKGAFATDLFDYNSSNGANDHVTFNVYDNMGREARVYMPYSSNDNTGNIKTDPVSAQNTTLLQYYNSQNETIFYSQDQYEVSPLGRVVKSMPQGASWIGSNRGTTFRYLPNTEADDVRIWNVVNSGVAGTFASYSSPGEYPSASLFKTISTDENGKQVIEFKNREDQVILKKVQFSASLDGGSGSGHTGWLCTYYIYDEFGRMRCVLQPKGVELISSNWILTDAVILAEQCFRYEFDIRGRMIVKKTPGCAEIYSVYDNKDRLVMSQDGNMRGGTAKWLVNLFDINNRPVETGLWSNSQSLSSHITAAISAGDVNYPFSASSVPGSGYEMMSKAGFDNYANIPAESNLTASFNNSWQSYFIQGLNAFPDFAQDLTPSNRTSGVVTWTQTKLLGSTPAGYIYTVNIYDDRGRIIQVKERNATGGEDITTTQYNFSGLPLLVVQKLEKGSPEVQINTILNKYTYDDLGRVLDIHKKVSSTLVNNGAMPENWNSIVRNEYDYSSKLIKRELGGTPGTYGYDGQGMPVYSPGNPVEVQELEYNVRGWQLSLNKSSFLTSSPTNKFAYQLAYDKSQNIIAGQTYSATPQYNGSVMGVTWRSFSDDEKRRYDFSYDEANRLIRADFKQYDGTAFSNSTGVNLSFQAGDGINGHSAYDANGNLKAVKHWGLKLGSSLVIDDFTYSYKNSEKSNRLQSVTESAGIASSDFNLGDFTDKNRTGDDYDYDVSGNMTLDKNKGISSITYNHLNLPQTITVTGKGTISYLYDASGQKWRKTTVESNATVPFNGTNYSNVTITTTTNYNGGEVYESKTFSNPALASLQYVDRLLFLSHEEGRIRFESENTASCPAAPAKLVYDFMIRDHLGSVRMVLAESRDNTCYIPATIETTRRADESRFFNINSSQETNVSAVSGASAFTQFEQKFYKVSANASNPNQKTGLGMALKVMSGDKVALSVQSYYNPAVPQNSGPNLPVQELLGALIGSNPVVSGKGLLVANDITAIPNNLSSLNDFVSTRTPSTNAPRAYLNWILFDDQLRFVSGGSDPVGSGSYKFHNQFMFDQQPVNITRNGYLYVYVSNETPNIDVYFDNLSVTHKPGPLLEESHYYPYGLTMEGISSKAALMQDCKAQFNGMEKQSKEFSDGQGLNLYDYGARMYDVQTARWGVADPMAGKTFQWSPYNFAFANPGVMVDRNGMFADYYDIDGSYLGSDGIYDRRIFVTTNKIWKMMVDMAEDNKWDHKMFAEMIQLNPSTRMIHSPVKEFQTAAQIIKREGVTTDSEEYLWIAHASNNNAKSSKTSLYKKLMTGFSSVKQVHKVPLETTANTPRDKHARAAVIDVLLGNQDPTGGAKFWDGTDFLAWGLKDPKGERHNKFEEYYKITISQDIFYTYLNSNKAAYPKGAPYRVNGKKVYFALPAEVFTVQANWDANTSTYSFPTGSAVPTQIIATGSKGRTIFWRVTQ